MGFLILFIYPHLRTYFFHCVLEKWRGRWREGGGERERETLMWERNMAGCLLTQDQTLNLGMCPWPGINPTTFQSVGQHSNQLSHTGHAYLFLRERWREGEIEKEKHQCVRETKYNQLPLACAPTREQPTIQACALTRNWTSNLSLYETTPNQLSHTGQSAC